MIVDLTRISVINVLHSSLKPCYFLIEWLFVFMVTFSHYSAFIVTTRFTEGESQDQGYTREPTTCGFRATREDTF
jgi:hypothetical protein